MQRYKNLSGHSGVTSYRIIPNGLLVEFNHNAVYQYTYSSAGRHIIGQMQRLARSGRGLSTYISRVVRHKFDRKIR
jgi:hypothetical protein